MKRDPDVAIPMERGSTPTLDEVRRERFARLAAAMPLGAGLIATIVFVAGLADTWGHFYWRDPRNAVISTTWLCAAGVAVMLRLAGRGARIPAAMPLLFAGLPWLLGVACTRVAMRTVVTMTPSVDRPFAGIFRFAHAGDGRSLGAWCTAALAAALAIGLAVAARGQCTANRKSPVSAVGLALATPVLALAGYAVRLDVFDSYSAYGVVTGLAALTAVSLGAAVVRDARHARPLGLAVAVVPVALVSFLAAGAAMQEASFYATWGEMAWLVPAMREALVLQGAESFASGLLLAELAMLVFALATLVLAAWAASHARPALGGVPRGAALALVAVLIVGADRAAVHAFTVELTERALAKEPWRGVENFVPVSVTSSDEDASKSSAAVVTVDAITPAGGNAIPLSALAAADARNALAEELRAIRARGPGSPMVVRYWRYPSFAHSTASAAVSAPFDDDARRRSVFTSGIPAIELTIDARVRAPALRALFDSAHAAGAQAIVVDGAPTSLSRSAMARLDEEAGRIAIMLHAPTTITLLLEDALPDGYARLDGLYWHATVGRRCVGELTTRTGGPRRTLPVPAGNGRRWARWKGEEEGSEPHAVAYLALADDATLESLAAFAEAAMQHGLQPLVFAGAVADLQP